MFVGSFATQWGIGLVVDAARVALGVDTAAGLAYAFVVVLVLDVVAYAWFARGWKRYARRTLPAPASA